QVFAELKNGPLTHLPSGRFSANAAWLGFAVLAFNLSRAAACRWSCHARMATIHRVLTAVPARIASSGRRRVLHLPQRWPWRGAWRRLWDTATGTSPPPPATIWPSSPPAAAPRDPIGPPQPASPADPASPDTPHRPPTRPTHTQTGGSGLSGPPRTSACRREGPRQSSCHERGERSRESKSAYRPVESGQCLSTRCCRMGSRDGGHY